MAKNNTMRKKHIKDVVVIGAGASGLMSAVAAARRGALAAVLNHHSVPGKKILSTGNGKCNFTNQLQDLSCYRSDDQDLVAEALRQFSATDAVAFFEEIGVYAKPRNGYYYPLSNQAVTVRDALLEEAENLGVEILNDVEITDIKFLNGIFRIETRSEGFEAKKCILATGGISAPKTGSDGTGYAFAVGLGHTLVKPLPALVPLISRERWIRRMAGVRCDGSVTLYIEGRETASDRGELQFTESGISGIPVFQVSRYAAVALNDGQCVEAVIDFFPDRSAKELEEILSGTAERLGGYKNWFQILCGLCNRKTASVLCDRLKLENKPVQSFSAGILSGQAGALAAELKKTVVDICGTGQIDHAQTTCGGIPLSEIGADMQSRIVPGLYLAGEILNVDGICGGYNLQWAWTSGWIAGSSAAKSEG